MFQKREKIRYLTYPCYKETTPGEALGGPGDPLGTLKPKISDSL